METNMNMLKNDESFRTKVLDECEKYENPEMKQAVFAVCCGLHKDDSIFESAVQEKGYEFVQYFLDNGAIPTKTSLEFAIENGNSCMIELLLEHYSGKITEDMTYKIVKTNNDNTIELLLNKNPPVNTKCILYCIQNRNQSLLYKLEKYYDKDKVNITLYEALTTRNFIMVRHLLKKGVEVIPECLIHCIRKNDEIGLSKLLKKTSKIHVSVLHAAIEESHYYFVKKLLKKGAIPDDECFRIANGKYYIDELLREYVK